MRFLNNNLLCVQSTHLLICSEDLGVLSPQNPRVFHRGQYLIMTVFLSTVNCNNSALKERIYWQFLFHVCSKQEWILPQNRWMHFLRGMVCQSQTESTCLKHPLCQKLIMTLEKSFLYVFKLCISVLLLFARSSNGTSLCMVYAFTISPYRINDSALKIHRWKSPSCSYQQRHLIS